LLLSPSVCSGCISSKTAMQIWLKFCTGMELCSRDCISHFGGDRDRGPTRGAKNLPSSRYCVSLLLTNLYCIPFICLFVRISVSDNEFMAEQNRSSDLIFMQLACLPRRSHEGKSRYHQVCRWKEYRTLYGSLSIVYLAAVIVGDIFVAILQRSFLY